MKRQLVPCCVVVALAAAHIGGAQEVDRVGLSFSDQEFDTARSIAVGTPVTVYLLAALANPIEGVTSFSCQVEWNGKALEDLAWEGPVTIAHDGVISATFPEARLPIDGRIVLATATGRVAAANCDAVRIANTPVVVGTQAMNRNVPVANQDGEKLSFNCEEDLGPPGPPGPPTLVEIEKAPPLHSDGAR
jgi:hypothetical protein